MPPREDINAPDLYIPSKSQRADVAGEAVAKGTQWWNKNQRRASMSQRDVLELAYRGWTRIPNYQRVQAPE